MADLDTELLRQLINDVGEMRGLLGEIKGAQTAMREQITAETIRVRTTEIAADERGRQADERIRGIEQKVHTWSGAAGLAGVVLGYFGVHIPRL